MMLLTKTISRVSSAMRHEQGHQRRIVASFIPPAYVGFRLSGKLQTYLLDLEVAYELAVHQFARDIERQARRIQKQTHCRMASARKQAEKAIRDEVATIVRTAKEATKRPKLVIECCLYHAKGGAARSCRITKGKR